MQRKYKITAIVVLLLVGSVFVSRTYHIMRASDPDFISKRKVGDCFSIARQLMKSPSGTNMVKSFDLGPRVSVTLDAPNSFGVKLRAEVICEMKPVDQADLKNYYIATSATIDGKPVDELTFAVASSNALREEN